MSEQEIYLKAHEAAMNAAKEYLETNGEGPFNCGFAWVTIKPARGKMVTYLKSIRVGSKAYDGGYQIWNPSNNMTQDMSVKYAGAIAFAKVLKDNGINATAGCRLD